MYKEIQKTTELYDYEELPMIIMKGNSIEKQKDIRISEVMTVGTKKINYMLTL